MKKTTAAGGWGLMPAAMVCLLLALTAVPLTAAERVIFAGGNHILAISEARQAVTAEIPVGKRIRDMAVDPRLPRVYAAHSGGVDAFDTMRLQPVAHLTDEPARRLAVSKDGQTLYVLSHPVHVTADGKRIPGEYAIQMVDLASSKIRSTVPLGYQVLDAVIDTERGRVFSLERHGHSLDVHALADGRRTGRIAVRTGADPMHTNELYMMSISPDGRYVFVPQLGAMACVYMVDTWEGTTTSVSLGGEAYVRDSAVSTDGRSLYLLTAEELIAVDTARREVRGAVMLDLYFVGLDISADGERLYLSCPVSTDGGGSLRIYDAKALGLIGTISSPELSLFTAAATGSGSSGN